MMKRMILFFLAATFCSPCFALVELNGEYGFSTQKYGSDRSNEINSTTFGGAIALYLFDTTAIEVNYSQTETLTTENNTISIDSTFDLISQENNVLVYSYGVGIRQAFASRKARFRPSISLGYARQFIRDTTRASFRNNTTGAIFDVSESPTKLRDDSVFGSFNIELRLTQRLSLRGSVKTIFRAFEFDRAQDNLRYLIGFSWFL